MEGFDISLSLLGHISCPSRRYSFARHKPPWSRLLTWIAPKLELPATTLYISFPLNTFWPTCDSRLPDKRDDLGWETDQSESILSGELEACDGREWRWWWGQGFGVSHDERTDMMDVLAVLTAR